MEKLQTISYKDKIANLHLSDKFEEKIQKKIKKYLNQNKADQKKKKEVGPKQIVEEGLNKMKKNALKGAANDQDKNKKVKDKNAEDKKTGLKDTAGQKDQVGQKDRGKKKEEPEQFYQKYAPYQNWVNKLNDVSRYKNGSFNQGNKRGGKRGGNQPPDYKFGKLIKVSRGQDPSFKQKLSSKYMRQLKETIENLNHHHKNNKILTKIEELERMISNHPEGEPFTNITPYLEIVEEIKKNGFFGQAIQTL